MRRRLATTLAALALIATGCGDDEQGTPIPAQQADDLLTLIDLIENNVDSGACQGAESKITDGNQLRDKVDALPDDVDAEVRTNLEDGVDRLVQLVREQCGRDEDTDTDTPTETETTETTPPETETTPTETETTETTPPPTETTPPPTETTPPPTETQPTETVPKGGGAPAPGSKGAGTTPR